MDAIKKIIGCSKYIISFILLLYVSIILFKYYGPNGLNILLALIQLWGLYHCFCLLLNTSAFKKSVPNNNVAINISDILNNIRKSDAFTMLVFSITLSIVYVIELLFLV